MKLLIIVQHPFELWQAPPWFVARLRADFPQLAVVQLQSYEHIDRELATADVFVGWSLKPEQLARAKQLRWIHSPAAAVHALMSPELAASNVTVTNARDVHGPVVAEHALALLLALAKRIPSAVRYQDKRTWAQQQMWDESPRPRELAGATLAVVGFGTIGREVARLAAAFGMRILAVREHPESSAGVSPAVPQASPPAAIEQLPPAQLERALGEADFVVLAAPLTEKTRGMMNAARLARMRPSAYLVNVARGPLIDDAALVAALEAGKLGGAALDVFPQEPLPADSPYWTLPNVLITPHSAALTDKLWERHYALLADNLRRFLAGQPLRNVVDKSAGY